MGKLNLTRCDQCNKTIDIKEADLWIKIPKIIVKVKHTEGDKTTYKIVFSPEGDLDFCSYECLISYIGKIKIEDKE